MEAISLYTEVKITAIRIGKVARENRIKKMKENISNSVLPEFLIKWRDSVEFSSLIKWTDVVQFNRYD